MLISNVLILQINPQWESAHRVIATCWLPLRTALLLELCLLSSKLSSCSVRGFVALFFKSINCFFCVCVFFFSGLFWAVLNYSRLSLKLCCFRWCWAARLWTVPPCWSGRHIRGTECLHRNSQPGCVRKVCSKDHLSTGKTDFIPGRCWKM